jgi:monofunctional biosynthetic peptidoglycan transglycosylase
MTTASRAKKRKLPWYLRPFKWLLWFIIASVLWVLLYAVVPPPVTLTMLADSSGITKDWTSLSDIDRNMVRAVIAAEDGKFCSHDGFDRDAIEQAIERNAKGKRMRGGSTVSQQTAKNVFLWPSRSFVRKAFEAYFTILIDWIWGKERILEVYLNVAEMGKGIYGAEAAAQEFFRKNAADLNRREASLITACLPNPIDRHADKPSQYVNKRAGQIRALIPKLAYPELIEHQKTPR